MFRHTRAICIACFFASFTSMPVSADSGIHGRVFGRLSDESSDSTPLSGATVRLLDVGGQAVAETTSAAGGYFELDVPPGSYRYLVSAEGYRDEQGERGVILRSPERRAVYNITLIRGESPDDTGNADDPNEPDPTGTLYGQVFYVAEDGSRVGIPGATVYLGGPDNQLGLSMVDTASNETARPKMTGTYTLLLRAGNYSVTAKAEGFYGKRSGLRADVPKDEPVELDIEMVPTDASDPRQGIDAVVRLVDETEPDPSQAGNESLRVAVIALDDAFRPKSMTKQSGNQWSAELPAGRYRVLAEADGYPRRVSDLVHVIDSRRSRVDLTLVRRKSTDPPVTRPPEAIVSQGIRGTVSFAVADGGSSAAAIHMQNVQLRVGDLSGGNIRQHAPDSFGRFRIDLTPGSYRLVASCTGWQAAGVAVEVMAGQYAVVDLELRKSASSGPTVPPPPDPLPDPIPPVDPSPTPPPNVPKPPPPAQLAARLNVQVWSPLDAERSRHSIGDATVSLLRSGQTVASETTSSRGNAHLNVPMGSYELLTRADGFESERSMIRLIQPITSLNVYLSRSRGGQVSPTPPLGPDPRSPVTPPDWPAPIGRTRVNIQVGGTSPTAGSRVQSLSGVRLTLQSGREAAITLVTGPDGVASSDLSPYRYRVTASRVGYVTKTESLLVGTSTINHRILLRHQASTRPTPPGDPNIPVQPPPADPPPVTPPPVKPPPDLVALTIQVGGVTPATGNQVRLLAGASISVLQSGGVAAVGRTDGRGIFTASLRPGTYQVDVSHGGYSPASQRILLGSTPKSERVLLKTPASSSPQPPVPPPIPTPPDIKMRQPTLTVQVGGKDPAGGNSVSLLNAATVSVSSQGKVRATGRTDASGVYRATLPSGKYEIRVTHGNHYEQKKTITLGTASMTERVLLNPRRVIE